MPHNNQNDSGENQSRPATPPILEPSIRRRARSNGFSENILLPDRGYLERLNDIVDAAHATAHAVARRTSQQDITAFERQQRMLIAILQARANMGNACGFEARFKRPHNDKDPGSDNSNRKRTRLS